MNKKNIKNNNIKKKSKRDIRCQKNNNYYYYGSTFIFTCITYTISDGTIG